MPLRLLSVLVLAACAAPAPTGAPSLEPELERIARQFLETHGLPGLAVGVVRGGMPVYAAGFGMTASDGGQPVTTATLFHMASVTKPFVATAVLQLVERGDVALDAPVGTYVPSFRMRDPRAGAITVRQVLAHVAGLPDVTDYAWDRPEYDAGALARWIASLADSALIAAPGEQWAYSNIGFELLAHLVAEVSGVPFEDYVQARILGPLGMRHSTLLMSDLDSTLLAFGHEADSAGVQRPTGVYPYNRRHAGSSTLHSSVDDMLRWALANLGRGALDDARILGPASYDLLWREERDITEPLAALATRAGISLPYDRFAIGLSWFLMEGQGHRFVGHSGGDLGFRTDLLLAPDAGAAVVVLANGDADTRALSRALLEAVLGQPAGGAP